MTARPVGPVARNGRVAGQLERLATFSDAPAPGVTRVLYTPTDLAARDYLRGLVADAGLALREDAVGNLFARWAGTDARLAPVATGSHVDAIPNAGRYDGTVGVLGGLEAIRRLKETGFQPRRGIELIVFTAEEPTRFGLGCLGSRAMTGASTADALRRLRDAWPGGQRRGAGDRDDPAEAGEFETIRRQAGYSGPLEHVRVAAGTYSAFVELHIEQGPELERLGVPIGVVTHIAAPATLRVTLTGEGGHAGAVLMPLRRDALTGGAEIALAVERAALGSASADSVATTGIFDVFPGAVNGIPSRVTMEIDVRDVVADARDGVVAEIRAAIVDVARRRSLSAAVVVLNADPPVAADAGVMAIIENAAADAGWPAVRLVSRAYHDSLFMPRICPMGMIFIPCRRGVSHRPDEYADPEAIERGIDVLSGTLARLSHLA